MIGQHRTDCGCSYCLRPTVSAVKNSGPDPDAKPDLSTVVQKQISGLLDGVPNDWYGGREVTQPAMSWDCTHEHTTKYLSGTYCRDCGRWL